jgi:hypothetical protein
VRAGGGRDKGFGFERDLCKLFSLWLSRGAERDLFERNVSSGGAFTSSVQRGGKRGVPGDLMSVHPLSYEFLQYFTIEAKFWKDLGLDRALWNPEEELSRVIRKQEEIGKSSKRIFLLVAKQNRRVPLVFTTAAAGQEIFDALIPGLESHMLWCGRIFVFRFDHLMTADPDQVVKLAKLFCEVRFRV